MEDVVDEAGGVVTEDSIRETSGLVSASATPTTALGGEQQPQK